MAETEHPPNSDDSKAQDKQKGKRYLRRNLMIGIVCVFALVIIGYGVWWLLEGQFYVSTDDAYVEGNRLMLTPQIAGTVVAIHADDTDRVDAGQPVIQLDRSNETVALDHAEAALGQAVRSVRQLYQQEDGERATIALRQAKLAQARRDYERNRQLLKINAVTRQQFQHSETNYHGAQQQLNQAQRHLDALQTQTDGVTLRQTPQVELSVANLSKAYLNLERTTIPAPTSGFIAQRQVQIGERVKPGDPMLAIVPLNQIWVEANFKETQLDRVRLGQPVTLTADQYGGDVTYHGHVVGISSGTGSAFELLPPQNATGNWIKIVRRVPVRISLRPKELKKHPLRIGLSMNVTVNVHGTDGPVLAQQPPKQPPYQTDIYRSSSAALEQMANRIIAANGGGNDATTHADGMTLNQRMTSK